MCNLVHVDIRQYVNNMVCVYVQFYHIIPTIGLKNYFEIYVHHDIFRIISQNSELLS